MRDFVYDIDMVILLTTVCAKYRFIRQNVSKENFSIS